MRRLLIFILRLVYAAVCFVAITIAWVIFDGLNDTGEKADVALVMARNDFDSQGELAWLTRVADRFKDGDFGAIIVSTAGTNDISAQPDTMRKYLEDHGVPAASIIAETGSSDTWDMAHHVSAIMKEHNFESVMLVTNYYRMTRLELALRHAGVDHIEKSHIGPVKINDSWAIAHEVFALYDYVGKTFLGPAAEKIKAEAKVDADKAKVEADHARDAVDKKLDSLPK